MNISLPQNDPNPANREKLLSAQRQQYRYNHSNFPGVAMVDGVPQADSSLSKFSWIRDNISLMLRIRANQGLQDINERGLRILFIWRLITAVGLYRLLNDDGQAGFWLSLLRKGLGIVQRIERLLGRKPKSENIEADAKAGKTDLVEARITTLAQKIQQERTHLPKDESLQKLAKETQLAETRQLSIASSRAIPSTSSTQDISGGSINNYSALFEIYDNLFQLIYLPCISKTFYTDAAFATQRVAGPNPLVIQKVSTLPTHFPVTDAQFQAVMGEQDSLSKAGSEGRLYLADYAVLEGVKTSDFPQAQKYLSAPLALFAIPQQSDQLIPVAIQCAQRPSANNPIFTPPPAGTPQSEKWSWLIAKTIVQTADGNYHELISHLGRTHLLIEPFAIATERQLAPNHPLNLLLRPHFEGTLFINDAALKGLVNPGGTVDKVLSGKLEESLKLTAKGVQGYPFSFNESMLPKTLASRGVDNVQQLPNYPYRDDGLLIWDAIHQWVQDYLDLYYPDDTAIGQDSELQAWLNDVISPTGGKIADVGETTAEDPTPRIRTKAYLIDAVTLIIFTASAQHAAVNFPQSTHMTYGPNMPLASYQPAPTQSTGATAQDYLALLPPLEQAEAQMNMTYPLGSLYYTRLGEYAQNYFSDPQVAAPLNAFQQQLKRVAITIDDRNAKRATPYEFLHPAYIPQSINI